MQRRTDRYAMDLTVELITDGEARRVPLADLSRTGMFLRVSPPLPVGEPIHVAMFFEGRQLATPARVVHALAEPSASVLGRRPGIGIAFERPTRHADALFLRAVDRMLAGRARPHATELHVVVADPSTRLLERLSTELAAAGCSVATATNGLEAIGACMRRRPDVLVVDRALPVFDGFQVLGELAHRDELRGVPVIVMALDADDLTGAFDRGAKDVLHKPFTSVELASRCWRLARARHELPVVFRAELAELSLAAVLVMLEQERKSGRLEVVGASPAWIELANGTIAGAGFGDGTPADPRTVVMSLLDCARGEVRLVAAPPGRARVTLPITYMLLEHARVADERRACRASA